MKAIKKVKRIVALMLVCVLVLSMAGCKKEEKKTEIVVLAAASLTDVSKDIKAEYEKQNKNVTITFSYGSSGALMNQIKEGAPADVFISAAKKQMNTLNEEGFIKEDSVVDLLENKIVLIVPKSSESNIKGFEDILTNAKMIALGEPESVPVGQYSEEIFKNMNILDEVTKKAVYGSDVRAVLSYVESGNADCGIVYATDAKITENVVVVAEAPEGMCSKVIYPVGVIKETKVSEEATEFVKYLQSEEAMKIFEKYGFSEAK